MYKITVAKDNLNILINDLGKKITSSKPLIISDDLYEKSLDIKKVAKLIKVEKVDDSIYINEQQKDIESKDSIEEAKDKVFIKTVSEDYIPEENKEELENKVFIANENLNDDIISNNNAFIKNVDNESDTEIKVEDIKEESTIEENNPLDLVDKMILSEVDNKDETKKEELVEEINPLDLVDKLIISESKADNKETKTTAKKESKTKTTTKKTTTKKTTTKKESKKSDN